MKTNKAGVKSPEPPELVTVSRETFGRLAEALDAERLPYHSEHAYDDAVNDAARALVDEVRGADR